MEVLVVCCPILFVFFFTKLLPRVRNGARVNSIIPQKAGRNSIFRSTEGVGAFKTECLRHNQQVCGSLSLSSARPFHYH
uniref:Putative secreted protein n=1 Tax=Anopheles darlingi TaxID=43151 RepID=A0A2M4D340_ANODA